MILPYIGWLEAIAESPYTDDPARVGRDDFNLPSQVEHVRVDGAIRHRDAVPPRVRDELVTRERAAAVLQEHAKQAPLLRRDLDGTPRATQFGAIEVDLALAEAANALLTADTAPELGTDTRPQFAHAEWLGDVVIGARVESQFLLDLLHASRHHDDRRRHAAPP